MDELHPRHPQTHHSKSIYIRIYLSPKVLLVVFALEFKVALNCHYTQLR